MPKRGSFRGNNRVWNNDRTDNFQMQDGKMVASP